MLVIPWEVDVAFGDRPVANWILIGLIGLVFATQCYLSPIGGNPFNLFDEDGHCCYEMFIHDGWSPLGLLGHMWLHGDLLHFLGNMLFLWVFGNAVCQKLGSKLYFAVYLILGFISGISYSLFSEGQMLGASGAINGIVGMYLMFYPTNDVTYVFSLFFVYWRTFSLSGYLIIILWFLFDVYGVVRGGGNVAYVAHIGGFLGGLILAGILLKLRIVQSDWDEASLLDLFHERLSKKKKNNTGQAIHPLEHLEQFYEQGAQNNVETRRALSADELMKTSVPVQSIQEVSIRYICPCGKRFTAHITQAGKKGICPKCQRVIIIPRSQLGTE